MLLAGRVATRAPRDEVVGAAPNAGRRLRRDPGGGRRHRDEGCDQVMNDALLAAQPTKTFVTVDQVAALGLFLCREEASAITGANLSMDGGWTEQ